MDFCVRRSGGGLVPPTVATPSGVLDLSVIDKLPALRCNARTLHVFKHGPGAAQIIREAFSKALVPYYPLAGRLKVSTQNELQIECTGEGIWFVDAFADCKLDAVDYFDDAMSIPYDKLLPDFPQQSDGGLHPLVLVQITQFACDGFVMGLIFCHSICDGIGAAQFLNAVGEIARGVVQLSVTPVWCRDFIQPAAPRPQVMTIPSMPDYQLEHAKLDISIIRINQLKQKFQELTGKTCTTFEVVSSHLWRSRTISINLSEDTKIKLVFFANCRNVIPHQPPLPKGFYGNCFFPVTITASSGMVARASNAQLISMIQEARTTLPREFEKWINADPCLEEGVDPFAPPLVYTTLFISEWGRLGFNRVDYGWDPPLHVVPIQGSTIIPVGILGSIPSPGNGIRLMTWCVQKVHLPFLVDRMSKLYE